LEALIVGVTAGVTGYAFGLGISHFVGPTLTGVKTAKIAIDPLMAGGAIFLSALLGILSSTYPAIQASKMDPTAALRSL